MKIQLDTTNKKVTLIETVSVGELVEVMKRLLPDGLWKDFIIEINSTIQWINPIVIDRPYPIYPLINPYPLNPQQPYYIGDPPLYPYPNPYPSWISVNNSTQVGDFVSGDVQLHLTPGNYNIEYDTIMLAQESNPVNIIN
jgi:hypothetical protein